MSTTAQIDQQIETLVQSPAFHDWQAQLTACFYDRERKDALIHQVREAITVPETGFTAEDLKALRLAVIARLVGLASRDVRRPPADNEPTMSKLALDELTELITRQFPYPIAVCYRQLVTAAPGAGAFGCLLDTFESLLHYLASVVLSVYWRDGAPDPMHNDRLLKKFYKGKWATGDLMEFLRETARLYRSRPEALPYPALVEYLFRKDGRPSPSLLVLEGFVVVRNEVWGHGAGRNDRFFASILDGNRQKLDAELQRCTWLTTSSLWLPRVVDDKGLVTMVDRLNGDLRLSPHSIALQLDPADLDIHGGDVVPERTVLVVNVQTGSFLPLFPLSLFHFQRLGEGVFFLNDLEWADQAVRLKKARYLAYDAQLERYEVRGGEPATTLLEARMRQLEQTMEQQGIAVRQTAAAVREQPDYDLPEVWIEQASHLSTFVGREGWLAQLHAWVEATGEGGYLLALGPPGQGKSALLARFAREMVQAPDGADAADATDHPPAFVPTSGCLLHMVKSHKNPHRFLQFLLWQAERALGTPLGHAAYQGDVDDLRNALVGVLEQLRRQRQRVLVIIDALDELDASGERVRFLPEHLPAGVCMVLSCRPDIPLVRALRQRLHRLTVADLPPLSAVDLPLFLERYVGRDWEPARRSSLHAVVDCDALFQRTGGNPLLLTRAMERIRDQVHSARDQAAPVPVIDVTAFPNTVEAVFEDIYTQMAEKADGRFTSDAGRLKARLLQGLAVAYQALSTDELRGLLRGEGVRLSLEETRDLVLQMSQYLLTYDGERFWLFHQGFADYIQQHLLGDDGMAAAHRAFCHWLSTPPQRRAEYRLRHLPAHLLEWGKRSAALGIADAAQQAFDDLSALLTDFGFVQARIQVGLAFDLVRDYQAALDTAPQAAPLRTPTVGTPQKQTFWNRFNLLHLPRLPRGSKLPAATAASPLQSWARFLDRDSHILYRFPHLFFQQALNQPADSAVSHAAETLLVRSPTRRPYLCWLNKPHTTVRSPLLRTLAGHTAGVTAVAVTPDSRHVISGSADGMLQVWEMASGQVGATLRAHTARVTAVAVTPDSRHVISGSADGMLQMWEVASGQVGATLRAHTAGVTAVAVTPDSRHVISGSADGMLQVWEVVSGQVVTTLRAHTARVTAVAVTPESRHIISGSADGMLQVWEMASGQVGATLRGRHTDGVTAVAVTPDSRHVISGSADGMLQMWEVVSGQVGATLRAHTDGVTAVAVTPDSRHVISGSADGMLQMWEVASGQVGATLRAHTAGVTAVAVTPESRHIISGSWDGTLKVWEVASGHGQVGATLRGRHTAGVTVVAVTPDSRHVISGSADGMLQMWEMASGRVGATLRAHTDEVTAVAVTPDSRHVISGSADGMLQVWEVASGQVGATLRGHTARVTAVAVTPDSRHIISGSWDGTLKVWEVASGQVGATLRGHTDWVTAVAVTPDSRHVISGSWDGTLKVWEVTSGQVGATLRGHTDWVTAVAVTPDSRHVISGSWDGTLKVWEVTSGQVGTTLRGHTDWVTAVAVTPDSRHVISGSWDGTLKVWEVASGQVVTMFVAAGAVAACAASHDGRIVCGDSFGQVYILRLDGV